MLILQVLDSTDMSAKADTAKAAVASFAHNLIENPGDTLNQLGQVAISFGLKVLAALAIYLIGAWLIRKVKRLLDKIFTRRNTDRGLSSFISSVASVALTAILIVITIGTLGINTSSLAALLAAGGMAVGMALSGTLQNFAGGVMLLAFKPFRVGDFIEAQGFTGTVTEMSIVNTRLTTTDNRSIIIPNGALSNGNINNYSQYPIRRAEWTVSLEYGTDAAACKECLSEIIRSDARVLDASTPGAADPFVAIYRLDESAIVFIIRAWVLSENYWELYFDYNEQIYSELPKAGFKFPFPQLDVHLV